MLVVLTGIDGSGKSTAARATACAVHREGRNQLLLSNYAGRDRLSLLGARYGLRLNPRLADAVESAIRTTNVLISHARAHRFPGVVIMDRHLHCQLALRLAKGLPRGRFLPFLIKMLPQPDLVIHFVIGPEQALRRVLTRGTSTETLGELYSFRDAYRALPEHTQFTEIDAAGSEAEVLAQLMSAIAKAGDTAGDAPAPVGSAQEERPSSRLRASSRAL